MVLVFFFKLETSSVILLQSLSVRWQHEVTQEVVPAHEVDHVKFETRETLEKFHRIYNIVWKENDPKKNPGCKFFGSVRLLLEISA